MNNFRAVEELPSWRGSSCQRMRPDTGCPILIKKSFSSCLEPGPGRQKYREIAQQEECIFFISDEQDKNRDIFLFLTRLQLPKDEARYRVSNPSCHPLILLCLRFNQNTSLELATPFNYQVQNMPPLTNARFQYYGEFRGGKLWTLPFLGGGKF